MQAREVAAARAERNAAIFDVKHHHRCYPNKATENYLIYSRNGLEYLDFRNGELNINRWLRGICQYGIMPANGLDEGEEAHPLRGVPIELKDGFDEPTTDLEAENV